MSMASQPYMVMMGDVSESIENIRLTVLAVHLYALMCSLSLSLFARPHSGCFCLDDSFANLIQF